jgi:broad specificity phosphatase PhoE
LALPLEVDDRLQELDFGEWEGRTWSDIETKDQRRFQAWANDWRRSAPPKGESIANLEHRVAQFMCDLRQEPVLVVTHAGPIRAMRVISQAITWEKVMADAVPYATAGHSLPRPNGVVQCWCLDATRRPA